MFPRQRNVRLTSLGILHNGVPSFLFLWRIFEMEYQKFLESIGCAPAEVKRMVESRVSHSFGQPIEEYNPASDEDEVESDEPITD